MAGYNLDTCISNFRSFSYWNENVFENKHGQVHKCISSWQYATFGEETLLKREESI